MQDQRELSDLIEKAKAYAQIDEFGINAVQTNERIVAMAPHNVDARNRLARCHLQAGRFDVAREMYRAVLELAPSDRIAKNGLREVDQIQFATGVSRLDSGSEPKRTDETRQGSGPASRLRHALDGLATGPSDMVEALLHFEDRLRPRDREWIRDMDETASRFHVFSGFTPRQSEVILQIYRRYFPRSDR